MGRFKGLPHWCMTDTFPSAYDVESRTAIEMVAKLYGSYEGLVKDYNNYVDEINKTIVDFETGVISDQTTFKETITKIVHDYIKMIDDKVKIQDATIAEAVDYMKSNIIYAITESVNEMKESGELAEIVVEGFNDAIARITTIETTLASVDAKAEKNIDDILDLNNRVRTAESSVSTMDGKVNQSTYAVNSMSKDVANVRTEMGTLSNEVASVKTTNTNINRSLTTLTGRVDGAETDINTLKGKVETLENNPSNLPVASAEVLGGIKVGANLTIAEDGTLSATGGGDYNNVFVPEEQLIGQWSDGGLLYRKIFLVSNSTGDVDIDITDLNTSTPFIDFSHSFISYSGYRLPLNRYAGTDNWITASIPYSSTSQKINIQFGNTFKSVSKTIVVVLEYTKKSS